MTLSWVKSQSTHSKELAIQQPPILGAYASITLVCVQAPSGSSSLADYRIDHVVSACLNELGKGT